jgi:hypothetical protein
MYSISINKTAGNNLVQGTIYEKFLSNQTYLSQKERTNLISSSIEILENCVPPTISQSEYHFHDTTGLVLGYVQSGKTLSFTSVMALACDNGYRVAIVIGGRTNLLLTQNTKRLKKDIGQFDAISVTQNENGIEFSNKVLKRLENTKNRMIVVTVLKHQMHLRNLADVFSYPSLNNSLQKKSILIFDDESDQASLNTYANSNNKKDLNRESAIYNAIKYLRSKIPNHSYIQYTATPQANLLIDYIDLLSPNWHVLIEPGEKYVGGIDFFKNTDKQRIVNIPENERYHYKEMPLEYPPKGMKEALFSFVFSSVLLCYEEFKLINSKSRLNKTSMMIHPCFRKDSIKKFYKWTKNILNAIQDNIKCGELDSLRLNYNQYMNENGWILSEIPEFEKVVEIIYEDFLDNYEVHEVIGDAEKSEFPWDAAKHHILVGGQLLDRGFTVEDLIVTYMPRDTKGINNADTIEQRCRFFGYKKDYLDFCKLYLPLGLKTDYESYVDHEIHLRDTLKKVSMTAFKRLGSPMLTKYGLNLTNKSRLSKDLIQTYFKGFKYFNPPLNFEKNNELVERFLKDLENSFLGDLKPEIKKDCQDNNTHRLFEIDRQGILEFLSRFDIGNSEENIQRSHIERLVSNMEGKFPDRVFVIQIAYKRHIGRPRTINESNRENGNPLEIKALDSNYPDYFGDRKLLKTNRSGKEEFGYENNLIVQLHKIYAEEKTPEHLTIYQKSFYTLAFSFPDKLDAIIVSNLI